MRIRSHSWPLSGPVAVMDTRGHLEPTTVQHLDRVGEGISSTEGGVPGWVVLWSLQHSEKVATTEDKHKHGTPAGQTDAVCLCGCLPAWAVAWGEGGSMATEHPGRHPKTSSPQWKVCISQHRAVYGWEKVAIHQTTTTTTTPCSAPPH